MKSRLAARREGFYSKRRRFSMCRKDETPG